MEKAKTAMLKRGFTEECRRKYEYTPNGRIAHDCGKHKCNAYMPVSRKVFKGGYKGPRDDRS